MGAVRYIQMRNPSQLIYYSSWVGLLKAKTLLFMDFSYDNSQGPSSKKQ